MKHIKQTSQILKEKYKGDIPTTAEELIALPGKFKMSIAVCGTCIIISTDIQVQCSYPDSGLLCVNMTSFWAHAQPCTCIVMLLKLYM